MHRSWRHLALPLLFVLAAVTSSGCATYSDRTRLARSALLRGDLHEGEARLNDLLGVESSRDLPREWGSETALTVLERATVLQAMGDYRISARDFTAAEKELEILDIAADDIGAIGKYVYSDDSTKYKTTPTEKLLLNGFNMINYLAQGDLAGARVEARRFQVMRSYLKDYQPGESHGAFGAYLAGFVAERLGEPDEALRYYDEVLAEGPAPSLTRPIRRLARLAPYRTPRLTAVIDGAPLEMETSAGRPTEVLIVLKSGAGPVKEAARIPIGLALGLAANHVSGDVSILQHGALKVVSYPELIPAKSFFSGATVRVDGQTLPLDPLTHVSQELTREYESLKPKIVGAAITRLIVRAAAAEAARAVGNRQSGGVGLLAALLVEGSMVALDKPDTRSWSTLPAQISITRMVVPPGTREIEFELYGRGAPVRVVRTVEVSEGGFAVVDLTMLR